MQTHLERLIKSTNYSQCQCLSTKALKININCHKDSCSTSHISVEIKKHREPRVAVVLLFGTISKSWLTEGPVFLLYSCLFGVQYNNSSKEKVMHAIYSNKHTWTKRSCTSKTTRGQSPSCDKQKDTPTTRRCSCWPFERLPESPLGGPPQSFPYARPKNEARAALETVLHLRRFLPPKAI